MHITRIPGRTSRRLVALASAIALTATLAAPAAADIDKNPNALPFGPSVCDDGREYGLSYTPTEPAPVGFNLASGVMGVSHRLAVIAVDPADPLGDYVELEVLRDRPGKGLDQNTVRCVFPLGDTDLWLAAEINFNR
jgi:hypothetical protein